MAIIRHGPAPEDHYSLIPNCVARDENLTLQAKGIYLYLRSHREGWQMSTERIGDALNVHRDTVAKYVKELEATGYLQRERTHSDGGQFEGMAYVLNTSPLRKNTDNGKTPLLVNTASGDSRQHKKTNSSKKTNPKEDQAHRLPDAWQPSQSVLDKLSEKHPGIDLMGEATKFRGYWHEATGARAKKKNWDLAFGNWVSKAKPSWQDKRNAQLAQAEAWSPRTGIIDQEAPF